ncbi:MAG: hypothetical protein ACOYM3_28055 [Terrimicrobiaceae bacterium]
MALDITKLENVKPGFDGKVTARCPACAADGADAKGEHLVVFPGGKYGCVANEGDAPHSQRIYALAGDGKRVAHVPVKITVDAFVPPESRVLMDLGRFGRFSAALERKSAVLPIPFIPAIPVLEDVVLSLVREEPQEVFSNGSSECGVTAAPQRMRHAYFNNIPPQPY